MKLFKKLESKYIELIPETGGRRSKVIDQRSASRIPHLASRIAILGDIHANLEALNAVLADARAQGISQFICTGDVVGYGANPSECLKIIRDLNCPVVHLWVVAACNPSGFVVTLHPLVRTYFPNI